MRRAPTLLLLLTLCVAVAWSLLTHEPLTPLTGTPPVEAVATTPRPVDVAQEHAARQHVGPAPSIDREPVAAPGVFGVVLDFDGAPLPELQVYLLADGRPVNERRVARADAEGRFAFADADGQLRCGVHNHLSFEQLLDVAPGRHVDVVLRATEPCVLLSGRLLRGGEPVAGRRVHVTGLDAAGEVAHTDVSDPDGAFLHLLHPGDYRMTAAGPETEVRVNMKGNQVWATVEGDPTADVTLRLGPTPTRVHRDVLLPTGSLHVSLQAPAGALEPVAVSVACAMETWREWTRRGGGTFVELAPGDYLVRISAPLFLDTPTQRVHVGVAPERLDVVLQPAGCLLVKLRQNDELFEVSQDTRLVLRRDGESFFGRPDRGAMWRYQGHLFVSLPPGQHLLSCEDIPTDVGLQCAPCEPFGPIPVEVVAGESRECAVAVRTRPLLSVKVARDEEPVDADITVVGATGLLAPTAVGVGQWVGYVPPGDYQVRVVAGATITKTVHVDDTDFATVVELPASTGR